MYTTPEQFSASAHASVDAAMTLVTSAFAGAERLAALNLNTARAALEDSIATTRALMAAKDPEALLSLHSAMVQPLVEKAIAYSRNVYEIAAQTQGDVAKLVESKVAALNKDVADALTKSAPAGSDVAVAAVKSAIAAANSAYDSMSKAAKQVTEMAEANVAAATSATLKAVTPIKAGKKAA